MADAVTMFGAAATEKLLDNAISYYTQKNLNAQQQANTQKNMRLQAELEDQSWYNRIAKSTSALRDAGLSPALATGQAQGAAAVSHNEPLAQAHAPQSSAVDYINTQLNESQIDLNKAAAEKARAEAAEAESRVPNYEKTGREIEGRIKLNESQVGQIESMVRKLDAETLWTNREYMRKLDEDKVSAQLVRDEFKARFDGAQSQYEKDFWQAFLDDDTEWTTGALMALRSWTAYNNEVDEWQKEALARQVQKELLKLQIDDSDVLYSLAHMPVQDFLRVQAEVADLVESAKFRKASRELGLPAQAEFMEQQAKTMKNNDFVGHVNSGEYGQAALTQVPSLLRLVEEGAMLYLLRGKTAGSDMSGKPTDLLPSSSRRTDKGIPEAKWNRIQEKASQIDDPVRRAQYIDKSVRAYHAEHP